MRGYEAPQGEVEEKLAAIWSELLKVEQVGRQDNFFELGGHSLLATRMLLRIRQEFGVNLPVRVLFEISSVAELALRIGMLLNLLDATERIDADLSLEKIEF